LIIDALVTDRMQIPLQMKARQSLPRDAEQTRQELQALEDKFDSKGHDRTWVRIICDTKECAFLSPPDSWRLDCFAQTIGSYLVDGILLDVDTPEMQRYSSKRPCCRTESMPSVLL